MKYLEQQMLRPAPEISEALTVLGQVIFGGHQTDRDEREVFTRTFSNPRQQQPNFILREMARIWAQAGATVGSLDASWTAAHRAARSETFNAPAPTPKRKLEDENRYWRTGGGSSSSSSTWRTEGAWADAGARANEAGAPASTSRWEWHDPTPPGTWVAKKAKEEQQQWPA